MLREEMLKLKVGDTVCDCRFQHLKIVGIKDILIPPPSIVRWFKWLPFSIFNLIYDLWPKNFVADKDLILENGSICSATSCADLVDHKWEHPAV